MANPPIEQSGEVTPGHLGIWVTNGVLADGGVPVGSSPATNFNVPQFDNGTLSGAAVINVENGSQQKLTVGGALSIGFTGWPLSGIYAEVEIELVNGGTNVTWPAIHWLRGDGTNNTAFSSMGVNLNNPGTNWVIVWSRDGGTNIWGRAA